MLGGEWGGGYSGVDCDTEEVLPFYGRCFEKLVHIFPGQQVQYRIIELKEINTSRDAFAAMLSNPKKVMEGQFEQLDIYGHPFQVIPYPAVSEVS